MPYFPMDLAPVPVAIGRQDPEAVNEDDGSSSPPIHPPKSIQVKNRRKRYLELHPDYFSPELELAGTSFSFLVFLFKSHGWIC